MKNLVFASSRSALTVGRMTFSIISRSICSCVASGACWVERTTASDAHGTVVVVFHGHLRLAVGPQVGDGAGFARLRKRGASICAPERSPAACTRAFRRRRSRTSCPDRRRPCPVAAPDAHGDVGATVRPRRPAPAQDWPSKPYLARSVADFDDLIAGDLVNGHIGGGGDLAHHQHHAGGGAAFAGHMGVGVLGEDGVEHGVGDLVADLIGMALGDGFRRKQSLIAVSSV